MNKHAGISKAPPEPQCNHPERP